MLSLLGAAQDYQLALARLIEEINQQHAKCMSGKITAEQALIYIAINARAGLMLRYPDQSPAVIKLESVHFAREKRRNIRKATKLRENRIADKLGAPRPIRGDGREYGKYGGSKFKRYITPQNYTPDADNTAPNITPFLDPPTPSIEASLTTTGGTITGMTEAVAKLAANRPPEVTADSDLDFDSDPEQFTPTPLDSKAQAEIDRWLTDQAAKEEYEAQYGRTAPAPKTDINKG